MKGKVWVTAAKGCNKIIFKGMDGAFYGIGAVQVGRDKLNSDAFIVHEGFEGCWALVVQHLESWAETALGQLGVQRRVCTYAFFFAL